MLLFFIITEPPSLLQVAEKNFRILKGYYWLLPDILVGKKPMMLLTSLSLTRSLKSLLQILKSYIRRWDVEEQIRFMKQTYVIENVRVLRCQSLQNLYPLVIATTHFFCARPNG